MAPIWHLSHNVLLEKHLVRDRNWVEFSVAPLFSPQALIAEGVADYGAEMVFPGSQELDFAREVLFPIAGLDPARAEHYYRIVELTKQLHTATCEASRRFLDQAISADEAKRWLTTYALAPPEHAGRLVEALEVYRSYVVTYSVGEDLVRGYVEGEDTAKDSAETRWRRFFRLLSTPQTPTGLSSSE